MTIPSILKVKFDVVKAQILASAAEDQWKNGDPNWVSRGKDGRFGKSGSSAGSADKSSRSADGDQSSKTIGKKFDQLFGALPNYGFLDKATSKQVKANADQTAKTFAGRAKKQVPEEGKAAFDEVVKAGTTASKNGFAKAMDAAMDAGKKALEYSADHPVQTAVGIVFAVGTIATAANVVGAIAAAEALEVGMAEFVAAEEGAQLSEAALEVAKIIKQFRDPIVEIGEKLAAGEISLADIGLAEGEEFLIPSEQEFAKMLNLRIMPASTAIVGMINTSFLSYIAGMAAWLGVETTPKPIAK